ncbi:unnamed protein product [Owenia fusiformis]|uniref:Uncharacterized protein n=1 Tax=Owenia fusiformis TaxID=6347 RepID=A0A8J1TGI8_OWEFU|nr:unnamed protein product [Owenia fusiformis]
MKIWTLISTLFVAGWNDQLPHWDSTNHGLIKLHTGGTTKSIHTGKTHATHTREKSQFQPGNFKADLKAPRKWKCTICLKTFMQKCHLGYHMNTHTGHKPYVCSICNQGFPSPAGLSQHMKNHHNALH